MDSASKPKLGFGHPVSEQHLKEIGNLVVTFNYLEDHVRQIFCRILSPDGNAGRVIASKTGFRQLRFFTLALFKSTYGDSKEYVRFEEILAKIESIEDDRNRVVHCTWGGTEEAPSTGTAESVTLIKTSIRKNRDLHHLFADTKPEDIHAITGRCEKAIFALSKFDGEMFARKLYRYVRYG